MRYPNGRILIFAKAPVPGYAKTRLIPVLGAQGAAELHARLIHRTVAVAVESRLAPVELWICGDTGLDFFESFRTSVDSRIHMQTGADLGARMGHAVGQALQDAAFAVLIGTDCPVLDAAYLERACAALADGRDMVLGPAVDGGYVLIGLGRPEPAIFENVAWGTSAVLAQTREQVRSLGLACTELPVLWDVDEPGDLARLARTLSVTDCQQEVGMEHGRMSPYNKPHAS